MLDTLTLDTPPDGSVQALYDRPGFLIRRAHQIVAALFEDAAEGSVTQTQFSALYSLRQRPRIDQITLAKLIGHDRSTTALVVKNLEAEGLVARTPDPDDRRRNLLIITPAGEDALARAVDYARYTQAQILSPFTPDEAAAFHQLLTKFVATFNDKIRTPIAQK